MWNPIVSIPDHCLFIFSATTFHDMTNYADCKDEVENEIHFMLQCPVYETLRLKYLPRKYYYISECKQV